MKIYLNIKCIYKYFLTQNNIKLFSIKNNKKCFLTLKTGVMAAENSALSSQEYIILNKYIYIYIYI